MPAGLSNNFLHFFCDCFVLLVVGIVDIAVLVPIFVVVNIRFISCGK